MSLFGLAYNVAADTYAKSTAIALAAGLSCLAGRFIPLVKLTGDAAANSAMSYCKFTAIANLAYCVGNTFARFMEASNNPLKANDKPSLRSQLSYWTFMACLGVSVAWQFSPEKTLKGLAKVGAVVGLSTFAAKFAVENLPKQG